MEDQSAKVERRPGEQTGQSGAGSILVYSRGAYQVQPDGSMRRLSAAAEAVAREELARRKGQ